MHNRSIPLLFTLIGLIWLGVLTFYNMMYVFYGWVAPFSAHLNDMWSKEEVRVLLVDYGGFCKDRFGDQFLPLALILIGVVGGAIQNCYSTKPNKPLDAISDKPGS